MTKFQFNIEEKDDRYFVSISLNNTVPEKQLCRFYLHYGDRKGCEKYFNHTRTNRKFCSQNCKNAFKQKPGWQERIAVETDPVPGDGNGAMYLHSQASFSTKKKAMEWMVNVEPLIDSIMEMSCEKD